MERTAKAVRERAKELEKFWEPRNLKMKKWYKLIEMVDELKTEKMESFVGNDPRAMYNLILHLLDTKVPHRLAGETYNEPDLAAVSEDVSQFFDTAWEDNQRRFRKTGPRQNLSRTLIGFLLATGWYSVFAIVSDDGSHTFVDVWNPAETYPMWDFALGMSEVAHIFELPSQAARRMCQSNGWPYPQSGSYQKPLRIYDYWWVDEVVVGWPIVWNAVVIGDGATSGLVKFEPTRFTTIPIYCSPVGGLPDMGILSEGNELSTSTYQAGSVRGDRWKEEIGQSILATNENIYRSWNKWWSFSLQLLRDTAQPRIFERSRSGKMIVKPENVFRRGEVFRGGPDDSVEFLGSPPMPLELRSTQLDLEAMMQRGGPSWAMYGNLSGNLTAYVMAQIAASANQVIKPFHQALINLYEDIDNDWLQDIRKRGVRPYGWHPSSKLDKDARIKANYEIEIPGELIQKATVARMLTPDFELSYGYTIQKLFPDIRNPMREKARINADQAERSPETALIAAIAFYKKQAELLAAQGDTDNSRLYTLAAQAAEARLSPPQQPQQGRPTAQPQPRPEAVPQNIAPTGMEV